MKKVGSSELLFLGQRLGMEQMSLNTRLKKNKSVELMVFSASGFSSLCLLVCVFTKALNEAWQL